MQTLNEDLKTGNFRTVYLLFGEEDFLKKSYKNRLKDAITGGDTINYHYYEGKGLNVDEIIGLSETMPFFADKRLILIEDSGFFKSAAEQLAGYIPAIPESSCLLFVESEVDKRGKMYKAVKKAGYAAELNHQDHAQLAKWAGGILSKEGRKITSHTMDLFLSKTGEDMENIRMELEKLISYTWGRDVITDQDVEEISTAQASNKIFEMISALSARQTRKALDLYQDLLTLKEPPMRILFLIARQFNQILQVKELAAKGMDKGAIAGRLKLQPFVVGKVLPQARAFSRDQMLSYVELCAQMEEDVKTGQLSDRLAVELLLTKEYGKN